MARRRSDRADRLTELRELLGVSRSTIYNWIVEGRFPLSVHVSERTVRWRAELNGTRVICNPRGYPGENASWTRGAASVVGSKWTLGSGWQVRQKAGLRSSERRGARWWLNVAEFARRSGRNRWT